MNVDYRQNDYLIGRFFSHFRVATKQDIGQHDKYFLEKCGDVGLWPLESLPQKIWTVIKEPRAITLLISAYALTAVSFVFYPSATFSTFKAAYSYIPQLNYDNVHFVVYALCIETILATTLRAYGRFSNTELMKSFYRVDINQVNAALV